MNSGRLISIIALAIGFGLTALIGLFLATQAASGEIESAGALVIGAFLGFVLVAPIFGFGIYMYAQSGKEVEEQSEMEAQRAVLDIVRSRGQVGLHDLAIETNRSVEQVTGYLHQLVGLQVFAGYINWDKQTVYSADASHLHRLNQCENCGAAIELAGRGVIACQFCGTEYFLPK